MRVWHPELYPYLCEKHLQEAWQEAWVVWKNIINKEESSNPVEFKVYKKHKNVLLYRMLAIKNVMLRVKLKPKKLPMLPNIKEYSKELDTFEDYQDVEEQINILESNNECGCDIEGMREREFRCPECGYILKVSNFYNTDYSIGIAQHCNSCGWQIEY